MTKEPAWHSSCWIERAYRVRMAGVPPPSRLSVKQQTPNRTGPRELERALGAEDSKTRPRGTGKMTRRVCLRSL